MAKKAKEEINKKKLFKELAIVFAVFLVIFLVRFIPWLAQQPMPNYNPNSKYLGLVNRVESYNYDNGRDTKLEASLDNATKSVGSDPVQYYYNQKAKAIYYYNTKSYQASIVALDIATDFAPSPIESRAVYELYIKNYTALGQPENVTTYQELIDALPQ